MSSRVSSYSPGSRITLHSWKSIQSFMGGTGSSILLWSNLTLPMVIEGRYGLYLLFLISLSSLSSSLCSSSACSVSPSHISWLLWGCPLFWVFIRSAPNNHTVISKDITTPPLSRLFAWWIFTYPCLTKWNSMWKIHKDLVSPHVNFSSKLFHWNKLILPPNFERWCNWTLGLLHRLYMTFCHCKSNSWIECSQLGCNLLCIRYKRRQGSCWTAINNKAALTGNF